MEPASRPVGKVPVTRDGAASGSRESLNARFVEHNPLRAPMATMHVGASRNSNFSLASSFIRPQVGEERKPAAVVMTVPLAQPASTSKPPSPPVQPTPTSATPLFTAPLSVLPRAQRPISPQHYASNVHLPPLPAPSPALPSAGSPPSSPPTGKGLDWMEFLKRETASGSSSSGSSGSGSGRAASPSLPPGSTRPADLARSKSTSSRDASVAKTPSPPSRSSLMQAGSSGPQMDWAGFLKSESSPQEKKDGLVGWAEALATIRRDSDPNEQPKETKEAKEGFLSRMSKAKLLSTPVEKGVEAPKFRDILNMESPTEMRGALKKFLDANPTALGGPGPKVGIGNRERVIATPYLLFEASEAHNLNLCLELLKLKASCTTKATGGNLPIHALMRSTPPINVANDFAQTAGIYDEIFRLTVRNAGTRTVLETQNDRGESPLFLACVAANFVAVSQLIAAQVNVFSAFMPDVRVASHGATFLSVHDAVMSAVGPPEGLNNSGGHRSSKDERRRSVISRASKRRSGNMADALLRKVEAMPVMVEQRPLMGTGTLQSRTRPANFTLNIFSPNDLVLTALAREPLTDKTVELLTQQFTAAYKQTDSWVLMQQLQLAIDRISPIKEERGRYYVGFSSKHEVLRCLRDSVLLYNATEKIYRWSIRRYFPDLSVWDPATVRLEILGARNGILRPQESARLSFNLLATTKVEFAELVQITLDEENAPATAQKALYFFLAASIAAPPDLRDSELDRSQLPVLKDRIGFGASAEVFKVANFLGKERGKNYPYLAVKKFNLRLEQGLEEAKEDFRRLTLELYISCKMDHPNVVHTLGFIASPLCLVMEFVETNLRSLIDDKSIPLGPVQQNKIALHIAKGMEYLHSYNVTHRDLKPANVLITSGYDAKITDFGISLLNEDGKGGTKRDKPKEALEGTTLYMAPECFTGGDGKHQKEGDVYSFGVILLELSMRISLIHELPDASRIVFIANRKNGLPPLPWDRIAVADSSVLRLIRACWAFDPDARPTFSQVVASVTEARRAALQLDLDSEMEEARRDGAIPLLLENWAHRFDDPDVKRASKFRGDFMNSRAMSAVLEHLILSPSLSDDEMGCIDRILRGHFGRCPSDLLVNLRALQPGLSTLAAKQAIPFLVECLTDALVGAELRASGTIAPRIGGRGLGNSADKLDVPGVFAWLEFSNVVRRDIRFQPAIGPLRYQTEREALQARMAELQEEMQRCERRMAKINDPQDAVAYMGKLMGLDPPPPQLPLTVLDRLDTDTASLLRQMGELGQGIDALAQCRSDAELIQRQKALDDRLAAALSAADAVQAAYPIVVALMEQVPTDELQAAGVPERMLALPESWEMLSAAAVKLRAHMTSVVTATRHKLQGPKTEETVYFF